MSQNQTVEFPELSTIKSSIPAEYFKSSLLESVYYTIRSAVLITLSAYALYVTLGLVDESNIALQAVLYSIYWFIQGTLFWGVFVLGHDCGHGSFSRYPRINQLFGNILHSFILVPYESWKTTHRLHHKNTGNIDKDEIFYPQRGGHTVYNDARRAIVIALAGAWITYLYINFKRHFYVGDDIYKGNRTAVVITHIFWAAFFYLFILANQTFGVWLVSVYYTIPLLVFMSWLVITTFLHHQDIDAPWYGNETWTYVKGNLSSIDRSYGYVIDNLIHNIGTHQIHHLFPIIPHYKLVEATNYFRKSYPQFTRVKDENIIFAFFRNYWVYLRYAVTDDKSNYFSYREEIFKDSMNSTAKNASKASKTA